MNWLDDLASRAVPPYAINDSKTPSGRAHVGALRGVLIHDSIYRHLVQNSSQVSYSFGCDDYDALDELPHGLEDFYRPYLGVPLCNVPPPPGTGASDIADYYISEFFDLFSTLDVAARTYRMRDLYRSGQMDEVIDIILRRRVEVREIYRRVNGSTKPERWHPFQVVCPTCGKIGSTVVTDYDGTLVKFECSGNLVKWAVGCGHTGWMSPFGGEGKLPWKLEWAARWKVLGVSIEGAGKDHTTRGGSRDVADAVSREVLGYPPPLSQPYEFFLVGGSKMSSSRGIGASAADIAQLLPPQVLRFLLIRTPARKALNFAPDQESVTRLFADYDRMLAGVESESPSDVVTELGRLSHVAGSGAESARVGKILPWDTVLSLVQLPHVDFWAQAKGRFSPALSESELVQLAQRVHSAEFWIENYARPEERVRLTHGNESLSGLTNSQRAFLSIAGDILENVEWSPEEIQAALFDAARLTPLGQVDSFSAIYTLFLGRSNGPRAGNLLAFLDRDEVMPRLNSVAYSTRLLIEETSLPSTVVIDSLVKRRKKIDHVSLDAEFESISVDGDSSSGATYVDGLAVARLTVMTTQGRRETVRAELSRFKGEGSGIAVEKSVVNELFAEFTDSVKDIVPLR